MGNGDSQGAPELLVLASVLGLVVSVCVAISQAIIGTLSSTTLIFAGGSVVLLGLGLAISPVETASRRHSLRNRIGGKGGSSLADEAEVDEIEPMTPTEIWSITRMAIGLKVVASFAHLWVMENIYNVADLFAYHDFGVQIAGQAKSGGVELVNYGGQGTSTFINTLGWQYIFFGSNLQLQAVIASLIALAGASFAAAASRRVLPVHRHRTATTLILLSPSMLFWNATIGKDAYMGLGVGAFLLALAMGLDQKRLIQAVPLGAFGLVWCGMFRAHVAFAMAAAVLPGLLLHRAPDAVVRGRNLKPVAIAIGSLGLMFGASRLEVMFGISASASDLSGLSEQTFDVRSGSGGTTLRWAGPVNSPLDVPRAIFTTNFRPLPFDGYSPQQLIQSAENMFYLGLAVLCIRKRKQWFDVIRHSETLSIGVFYVLFFSLGFATIENAGTLARQRIQWLPVLLMLLTAIDWKQNSERDSSTSDASAPAGVPKRTSGPATTQRPTALW